MVALCIPLVRRTDLFRLRFKALKLPIISPRGRCMITYETIAIHNSMSRALRTRRSGDFPEISYYTARFHAPRVPEICQSLLLYRKVSHHRRFRISLLY